MIKKQMRNRSNLAVGKNNISRLGALSKNVSDVSTRIPMWRRILKWLGWGIVYVFVFYLGNLSGEYVAAHMPILPSLPRISINTDKIRSLMPTIALPKVSMVWKWPTFTNEKNTTVAPAANTKLVVVRGSFISMPLQGATDEEKKVFVEAINTLAVNVKSITVADTCEINPPFIRVKQGQNLSVVSTATGEHTVMFDQVSKTLTPKQMVSVLLSQNQGAYAISCDGTIVGFYRVY